MESYDTARVDKRARRLMTITAGAASVVVVVSLALIFTSSTTTERVAVNARDLHWTNAVLGSAALLRAANSQAVFFAVDESVGVASPASLDRALQEDMNAAAALQALAKDPERPADTMGGPIGKGLDGLLAAAAKVEALIANDDVDAALDANRTDLESRYQTLAGDLGDYQQVVEDRIGQSQSSAGRMSTVIQFLVTLLIPMVVLLVYRWVVRRQLREQRIKMDERLRAEQRLGQAKDEFIAGLSHEFRTPLTSIYGFSELLLESELVDPSSSRELVGLINSESSELSRMVDDLLVAARLEAEALTFRPRAIDVASETSTVLAPWIRNGHHIEAEICQTRVWADPLRFRQVLRNLISNALKHGGSHVGVWGRVQRQDFVCSVVDDGPGIPDPIAGRIFDRFVHDGRHALLAGSVGLGLNIARSLVLEMGGELVYERVNSKTWFTFRLPIGPHDLGSEPHLEIVIPAAESSQQGAAAR